MVMTKAEAEYTAKTIAAQLGGNRFQAMTGAHSFTFDADGSLTFKYPTRKGFKLSAVKITLNVLDLYDVEFIDMKRNYEIVKKSVNNVYNDQLQSVFTAETGLYTSL